MGLPDARSRFGHLGVVDMVVYILVLVAVALADGTATAGMVQICMFSARKSTRNGMCCKKVILQVGLIVVRATQPNQRSGDAGKYAGLIDRGGWYGSMFAGSRNR